MLGSTRQYVQTYAYVCIASHRRICEATSPYGLTIVTTTFLFALMLFITSAGLAGVVHGSCAAQFLVAHFQHIQAGEGTVGFVYTGDREDEIGQIRPIGTAGYGVHVDVLHCVLSVYFLQAARMSHDDYPDMVLAPHDWKRVSIDLMLWVSVSPFPLCASTKR